MDAVIEDAVTRATTLVEAGFEAVMVENFGDVPFHADEVPAVTVAAITACVMAIRRETNIAVGVNVLRNDARAAVGIAAVTGAEFIRVNVLTGAMTTDQGVISGRAAEVGRERAGLCPDLSIWADVFVKHAVPPPGLTIEQASADTWDRGGADALVVSGSGTGQAPDFDRFRRVRSAVPGAPLVVGSGANPDNLEEFSSVADHIIVGTSLEEEGRPGADLDAARLESFAAAASRVGWM